MCYAIPGKIVELKDNIAVLDYFGEHRNVLNELPDAHIGDYAYAQGGVLINIISRAEAKHILNFWKQKFFELKKVDNKLAQIGVPKRISTSLLSILQRQNKKWSKEELRTLLRINNKEELSLLFQTANSLRQRYLANACCVHGII